MKTVAIGNLETNKQFSLKQRGRKYVVVDSAVGVSCNYIIAKSQGIKYAFEFTKIVFIKK